MSKIKLELNFNQMAEAVWDCITAGVVPLVRGRPGCGKSALGRVLAKTNDLLMIDVRLSQLDPVELNGFPKLDGRKAEYVPMDIFPIVGDRLPVKPEHKEEYDELVAQAIIMFGSVDKIAETVWEKIESKMCYKGWLLFFDELTNANRSVQAAAYKILLDRQVGIHNLHPKVVQMAAGNNVEDRAAAMEMTTALQSRLIHLHMGEDREDFLNHMIVKQWSPLIPAFLSWKPQFQNAFDPNHQDYTFSCERTWEFANDLIQKSWNDDVPTGKKAVLAGTLSMPVANEFMAFCRYWKDLPNIKDIISKPTTIMVPRETGTQYAVAGMIGSHLDRQTGVALMKYVKRLPDSMALLCVRMAYKRDKTIVSCDPVRMFIRENRKEWLD